MSMTVTIGKWIEQEAREFSHCPSYYAADYEVLKTRPGEYDLRLTFEGGYTIPMPYWLLVGIQTDRLRGALYSGFCGNNFAQTDLPQEPVLHTSQMYAYELRRLVEQGTVRLKPGFEWLLEENPRHANGAPKTWGDVKQLAG